MCVSQLSVTAASQDKVYGDVNGDGKVNIKDATDIQKFAASLTVANVGEKVPAALLPNEVEEIPTFEVEL